MAGRCRVSVREVTLGRSVRREVAMMGGRAVESGGWRMEDKVSSTGQHAVAKEDIC